MTNVKMSTVMLLIRPAAHHLGETDIPTNQTVGLSSRT